MSWRKLELADSMASSAASGSSRLLHRLTPGASTPGASTPGDSTPGALPPPPAPLPVGASTPGASTPGASILPVETIPPVAVPGWIGGQVLALTGVLLRQVDIDFYRRASYMTRKMAHKWLSRERQDRAIFITQDINTNEKRTIQHSDN